MVGARRFIVTAGLLAVAALLAGLLSAGPAGAGGRLAVWQVGVSLYRVGGSWPYGWNQSVVYRASR
jgi:hypothetical protein